MLSEERRRKILSLLENSDEPITGAELSRQLDVSRQVIVQDIALIRAQGHEVIATSNGYRMTKQERKRGTIKRIICRHEGYDAMEEELKIMVDMGAKILDVVVEHAVYGEIRRPLGINSRMDVEDFMENVMKGKAEPLSSLTGGEHIHTLEVPNERAYERLIEALKNKGYLLEVL